jgi:hypothetical protein
LFKTHLDKFYISTGFFIVAIESYRMRRDGMLSRIRSSKIYLFTIVIAVVLIAAQMVLAGSFKPGSQEDPVVTQSYVEQRNEQLKYYFEQRDQEMAALINQNSDRITAIEQKVGQAVPSEGQSASLVVVNLTPGQFLEAMAGTEIILRGGQATVVQSQLGGLCDVTAARDIGQDQIAPANHLLLVPRSDGRGVKAVTDCVLMVRGQYIIR